MADLTDLWTEFTRTVFVWAISPHITVPSLLGLSALTLMPRVSVWVKRLGIGAAVMMTLYAVLATSVTSTLLLKGLTIALPSYTNESADVAVVLGRGDELSLNRYDLALGLWQKGQVPKIFVTSLGRIGYMTNRFKHNHLPLDALEGTTCARTTYEEAVSAAAILQPQQVNPIILITDTAHMWRSLLTFRHVGFSVLPYVAPYPDSFTSLNRSMLALREYLGLIHYAILGRLGYPRANLTTLKMGASKNLNTLNCTVKWLNH